MATGTGTATLDFGATPGTNIAEVAVTGQAGLVATDHVEVFMMGTDSTATHNAYEHKVVPMRLTISSITAGVGFMITGVTDYRLDGTFKVRWVWAT